MRCGSLVLVLALVLVLELELGWEPHASPARSPSIRHPTNCPAFHPSFFNNTDHDLKGSYLDCCIIPRSHWH